MSLVVRQYSEGDQSRWDAFVERCPEATFFHRSGWREVLQRAFRHECFYLLAERGQEVEGILPLARIKSALFGDSLSSLPFCVYGGIAADTAEAGIALRKAACELADTLKVDSMEFRNVKPSDSGWPTKDLYFTFRKSIDPDNEVNLKAVPNKQRAMIRKGIKSGLSSEEVEDSSRLYRVYSESVRNLGTPVFSAKYLETLHQVFGPDCRTLMITDNGEDIAGVMSFYFRGEVLPYYGGSIARARSIKGSNDFMYWELMRRSAEEGLSSFDFGRSKAGTGPYSFKKNWGFVPTALPYEYYLVAADSVPNVNPTNPKYRLLVDTWKRLPLPVANLLGPVLARNLG
jgi:FemAB-related protein (PEP-CTERM system-associated)